MKRADNSIDEMTFVDMFFSEDTVAEFHKNHNLTQSIRTEAMKTATDRSWSGILQLMALAEVLKTYCSVVSVYQAVSYHFRPILNGRIFTSDNSDNNTHILHVLSSRDGTLDKTPGSMYQPNHFVPLLIPNLSKRKGSEEKELEHVSKKKKKQLSVLSFFEPKQNKKRKDQSKNVTEIGDNLLVQSEVQESIV